MPTIKPCPDDHRHNVPGNRAARRHAMRGHRRSVTVAEQRSVPLTRQQWTLFDQIAAGAKVIVDPAGHASLTAPGRRPLDVTGKYRALRRRGLVEAAGTAATLDPIQLTARGLEVADQRRQGGRS